MRYLLTFILAFGLIVFGGHAGRRAMLLSKKPEVAAAAWYDLWLDMEDGSDAQQVNRFMVTNMIRAGVASALVYSNNASRDSNRLITVSTAQKVSGTRSVRYDSYQDEGWIELDFPGDFTNVCGGLYFWLGPGHLGVLFDSYDWADLKATSGEFAALNYDDSAGNVTLNMHTGSGIGAEIPIFTNQWYWCAFQWNKLANTATYIFNSNGIAIGTSTVALASENVGLFRFARIDNHDFGTSNAMTHYDDIKIDTNGSSWAFPNGTLP